jgi:hypothetical protein
MDYFPLGDLRHHIPLGIGMDEQEVRTITRQLLDGLNVLHRNNLVHKDLKPSVSFTQDPPLLTREVLKFSEYPGCVEGTKMAGQNQRLRIL